MRSSRFRSTLLALLWPCAAFAAANAPLYPPAPSSAASSTPPLAATLNLTPAAPLAIPHPVYAPASAGAVAAPARPPVTRLALADAGLVRDFYVASDELGVYDTQGKAPVTRLTGISSFAAMQSAVTTLETRTRRPHALVLYPAGAPRTPFTRRLLTPHILVQLLPGADPATIAAAAGLTYTGKSADAAGYFVLAAADPGASLPATLLLRQIPGVLSADPLLARQQALRFVPNDPLFSKQWHLRNTGQAGGLAGIDANLITVWDSFRGTGIRIGIVDDGLQVSHPDLAPAADTANDFDWNGNDSDPSPDPSVDHHGTSCGGVAAGRGHNNLGISGAAPAATLVGLRLIGGPSTDADEADALSHRADLIQIKSNSWGPNDDGKTLEAPGPLLSAALKNLAQTGRGGRGTIITFAAGNGGDVNDNSNYDGYANSIYTIAVAALSDRGTQAYYSEPGANVVVTAPSNDAGRQGITTTDITGNDGYNGAGVSGEISDVNYTQTFGGTSSATPLVSGVLALLLEANPNLGWRDVQEILIRSAKKVSPTDTDWITNGAGYHFNHKFGAGLVDAASAITLGRSWTNLPAQRNITSTQSGLTVSIPDNNTTGVTRSFTVTDANLRVEHVTVEVDIAHTSRGQLDISLTSPAGTVSRLAEKHTDTGDHYPKWTFMTVRNWGESATGTWTLRVRDLTRNTTGTLKSATLTVFGSSAPASGGGTPPPPPPPPPPTGGGTTNPPAPTVLTLNATGLPLAIPDNNSAGLSSTIDVTAAGRVASAAVSLALSHSYRGDLKVSLLSPAGTEVVLHANAGGSADDLSLSEFPLPSLAGQTLAGAWKLRVVDSAAQDTGTLDSWTLHLTPETSSGGTTTPPASSNTPVTWSAADVPLKIPDNVPSGIESVTPITQSGLIKDLTVTLNIKHSYQGNLKVTLIAPSGKEHILHNRTGGGTDNLLFTNLPITTFNGESPTGKWRLTIADLAKKNIGTLNSWSLKITTADSAPLPPPPVFSGARTFTSGDIPKSIPDNNATGVVSTLAVRAAGAVTALQVSCAITHSYKGDLKVSLLAPSGAETVLHANAGGSANDVVLTNFPVPALLGQSADGTWRLKIVDSASGDSGSLTAWSLTLESR